jgi:hypothetical protein
MTSILGRIMGWFKTKEKKPMARPRPSKGPPTKALEYEAYFEVVEISNLKETLMKWHNGGFHPIEIKSIYVAAMPSDRVSILFGKRKANLV